MWREWLKTTTGAPPPAPFIIPSVHATAELLGQAPSIAALRERIRRLVERASHGPRLPPILLQGETGTGKSLIAHVIHQAGERSRGPFVDVNCAAIPEGLLEAELFGFERGAFTDARQPKAGLFQMAHGGTIFLDELSLLPDALQAKLLKVVEERAVRRLGGTRPEPVDVLIIAAANEDLREAVEDRRFRQDLYHRLAVVTVWLPPLRERVDDIPILAEHFLDRACKDYGLPTKMLTESARAALCAYQWPGNVREVANVMERAALLTETSRIGPEMLQLPAETAPLNSRAAAAARGTSLGAKIETLEREELRAALEETRWNVSRAAHRLGITRGTIRYRIAKYGLTPHTRRPRRSPSMPPTAPMVAVPLITTVRWEPRLVALLEATVRPVDEADAPAEFGRDLDMIVQKVESFAGRIEDATPARMLAAFGIEPSEDAPRWAALVAMAIQNAVGRARPSLPRSAWMTIAIHVDHCPVAEVSGRLQIDGDAKRRLIRVLEELRADAEPDAVVVSERARSFLGRRFDFADALSGEASPASGRRLLGYQQRRFGASGLPAPFVGRDQELGTLRTRWREAVQGRGQIVALVGEPGIGKSRLLFEFCRALGDESLTYLEGRGESYGRGIPYLPVIEFLKGHFGIGERDDPPMTSAKVAAQLHALDEALASDASPFLVLLGAPGADSAWQELEPAQRRQRTLDALIRFVFCLSQARPTLLAIEDLHWIDSETQAFLDRLVVSLPAARLLVLVSYRPEYGHTWGGRSPYTQLRLDPLATASAEELARSLMGGDVALQPLAQLVVERTEGNPFFLEESIQTLVETRRLVGERGAYRPGPDLQTLEIPPTVRAVLAVRIDRLASEEKQLLQAAAVVGKNVPFALLRAIADVPDRPLQCLLTGLQSAELLHQTRVHPEVEFTFKHGLTRDVAYEALPQARRRALHARMVEALEHFYADRLGEQVERLAHHALAAESWREAGTYCRQAGEKAAWRSAHREALQQFEHALRAIRQLPETRATLTETLDLHRQLGWSLVALGHYTNLAESLRAAEALAQTLADRHRLGEISLTMTLSRAATGDWEGAVSAGQRARTIGAALGDRALEIRATYQLGEVYRQMTDYQEAIREHRAVVDALSGELLLERFGEPSVLSVHARSWLATALAELGRFNEGIAVGEEAVRIAEEAANVYSVTNSHIGLGTVYLRRGDLDPAIQLLERAVALSKKGSSLLQLSQSMSALGASLTLTERVSEALPLLEHSVEAAAATGSTASSSLCMARLAEATLLAGRPKEASVRATRALDDARRYQQRGYEAWVLCLHGDIAVRDDAPAFGAAETSYGEAMALARSLGLRPLVARCHAKLGALYQQTRQRDQSREHLRQAATMFREMDMRFWLAKVEQDDSSSATVRRDQRTGTPN